MQKIVRLFGAVLVRRVLQRREHHLVQPTESAGSRVVGGALVDVAVGAESSSVVDVHFDVSPRALRRVAASCAAARRAAETLAPDATAEESDAPSTTATA